MLNKAFLVRQIQVSTNRMIASGNGQFLYLNNDGRLFIVGKHALGAGTSYSSPVACVGNRFYTFTAAPGDTVCGINYSDGIYYAYLSNWWGQFGNNTRNDSSSPVAAVGGHSFVKVYASAAYGAIYALKSDGTIWSWATNTIGQLGDGTINSRSSPISVLGNHLFTEVAPGSQFVLALKSNGQVWAWGDNNAGNLGTNNKTNYSSPVLVSNHSFTKIAAGNSHSIGIKSDGSVWCWGANGSGQLGNNTKTDRSTPVSVPVTTRFVEVACSYNTSYALDTSGKLWAWGDNTYGQVGDNTINHRSLPVLCANTSSFSKICASHYECFAIKSNGEVWCFGRNEYGQLGDGARTSRSSPVSMLGFPR